MKKLFIGAFVGGIIIFIWQTLSWAILNLHHTGHEYTARQDSVMGFLNTQFSEDSSYLLPNYPPHTTRQEMEKTWTAEKANPGRKFSITNH